MTDEKRRPVDAAWIKAIERDLQRLVERVYKLEQQLLAEQQTKAAALYGAANKLTVPTNTPVNIPGKTGLTIGGLISLIGLGVSAGYRRIMALPMFCRFLGC